MSDEILEIHGTQASLLVLRLKRNQKLSESDWTQTNDIVMQNQEEWVAYRQALRDLPANTEDPTHPEWPEPPEVKIVSESKMDPFATKAELYTTQTKFETTRADLDLTKADLQATKADLETTKADMATLKAVNQKLEARLAFLESALIS